MRPPEAAELVLVPAELVLEPTVSRQAGGAPASTGS